MKYRKKLSKKGSRKSFTRGATKINKKNLTRGVMRGGIRL